ncbi:hypothetical protein C8J56DRAFT_880270 [Mycena floridula]|nr:hypothetical protein C8J56DRAFT_880270 [Mycena floridula]
MASRRVEHRDQNKTALLKSGLRQALLLLEQVGEATKCPPLKVFAGSATSNQEECKSLAHDVAALSIAIVNQVEEHKENLPQSLLDQISSICRRIEAVHDSLKSIYTKRGSLAQIATHSQDEIKLQRLQRDIKHSLEIFSLHSSVAIDQATRRQQVLTIQHREDLLEAIKQVKETALAAIARAKRGPFWDLLVCHSHILVSFVFSIPDPGIGKSTLAVKLLHDQRIIDFFGDRRSFVSCDGAGGKDDLLTGIAGALGISGDRLQKKVLDTLKEPEQSRLLILDNFESPWEPPTSKMEVETLLATIAALKNVSIVITMRGSERPSKIAWTRPFLPPLKPLDKSSSRHIFLALSNCAEDDPNIDALLAAVDCVPLAVVLLAALAETDSTEILLLRWKDEHTTLLTRIPDRRSSLDISIKISIDSPRIQAVPEAISLLALMSLLPDGTQIRHLTTLFPGMKKPRQALSALWQTSLAYAVGSTETRVLSPIRSYMIKHHPQPLENTLPMITFFIGLAGLSSELGSDHGGAIVAQLTPAIGNFHAMVNLALEPIEGDENLSRLAVKAAIDLSKFQRYTNLGNVETLRLALTAAERIGESRLIAGCLFHIAWLLDSRDERQESEVNCRKALALYEEIGDMSEQAECHWLLGQVTNGTQRSNESQGYYEKALGLAIQSGNRYCQAKCLALLASVSFRRGEVSSAISQCEEALGIFRDLEHLTNIGLCLRLLGTISAFQSNYSAALEYYQESISVLEQAGAHQHITEVVIHRGDLLFEQCDFAAARKEYQRAVVLYEKGGIPGPYAHLSLGEAAVALRDLTHGRQCIDTAYRIFQKKNGIHGLLHCELVYGDIALQEQQYTDAYDFFNQALKHCSSSHYHAQSIICFGKLGQVEANRGRPNAARLNYVRAMVLYRAMTSMKGLASMLVRMAEIEEDRDTSLALFLAALPCCRRVGTLRDVADCLWGIGNINGLGWDHIVEARRIYTKIGDAKGQEKCNEQLARL